MKKNYFILFAVALLAASCGCKQKASSATETKSTEQTETVKNPYPELSGYKQHVITLPSTSNAADEQRLQVEIIPGITMPVDCNKHTLTGEMKEKTLEGFGYTYYVFETNREVTSTMMACPEDGRRRAFVMAQSTYVAYNSRLPIVVYAPTGIEVKHRVWQAGETRAMNKTIDNMLQDEAAKALKGYPEQKEGYERYVLLLPIETNAENDIKRRRIEIIPGITENADCNLHRLMGTFSRETAEGWGYDYFVFTSDGTFASTRRGCPDNTLKPTFISGETQFIDYNYPSPVVVFVPKNKKFDVRYRVWEAPLDRQK